MNQPIPEKAGRAIKRMYRQALLQDTEVGPPFELEKRILEDPYRPLWALCGTTVRLYIDILQTFGYAAEMVSLWNVNTPTTHASHEVVRFGGKDYDNFAYYDPLYGVAMVDPSGRWVGIREILIERETQSLGLVPLELEPYEEAASQGYQNINQHVYAQAIYPRYFNAVFFRDLPSSQWVAYVFDPSLVDPTLLVPKFGTPGRKISVYVLQQ